MHQENVFYCPDLKHAYRGTGEDENAPMRTVYFSENQYFKAFRLSHVGSRALDRDPSKVFKNVCFGPQKVICCLLGLPYTQRSVKFSGAPNPNFNSIDLVHINLTLHIERLDLNKTTREYSS